MAIISGEARQWGVQQEVRSSAPFATAIRNGEKRAEWFTVLALFRDYSRHARDKATDVLHKSAIAACAKGRQWQHALSLLGELSELKLECGSEGIVSYNSGIIACGKGGHWQQALSLLGEMMEANIEPTVISYSAAMSACEKSGQWQHALMLLRGMQEAKMVPSIISYSIGVTACEKSCHWQQSLSLLSETREAKLEVDLFYLQRWNMCMYERWTVAALTVVTHRNDRCDVGAGHHQLQRWDQHMCKSFAVATRVVIVARDRRSEART